MKIAIEISPLSSGHKVRGIGSYVSLIKDNIEKFDKKNQYVFFVGKKIPVDADLVHYPYSVPYISILPSNFKQKTIVTVHDLTPIVFKKHFQAGVKGTIRWMILKQQLKKADLIITDSDCSGKDVARIVGVSNKKIRTVYLATNDHFKKLKAGSWKLEINRKFTLPDNFLLYVGDATWNKNLPRLIRAIKKTHYKLVLVGKVWEYSSSEIPDHPWNSDFRQVITEIENDTQFIRLGYISEDDLVKIYNVASALIMPSIYEGFGLPVLEAMNCGCPVITSKTGSLPEIAGDAVAYIDYDSDESILKAIDNMFANPKLRDVFSKKGLTQSKKFTIDKTISSLVKAYESV